MDCTNDAYTVQPDFIKACELADTPATKRQASRFRMGKGRAYKVSRIIPSAPPVASWFNAKMASPCPPKIPGDATRDSEIYQWRIAERAQAREQWPKAWALKTLGMVP
jgi:hypothetical protein